MRKVTLKRSSYFWLILFGLTFHGILFSQTGSINGFVYDAANGEALIGANVYLEGTQVGSSTNINGYYVIHKVPVGNYTLIAHYLGYEPFKQKVRNRDNVQLTYSFQQEPW